jgi:hypothetical protein
MDDAYIAWLVQEPAVVHNDEHAVPPDHATVPKQIFPLAERFVTTYCCVAWSVRRPLAISVAIAGIIVVSKAALL